MIGGTPVAFNLQLVSGYQGQSCTLLAGTYNHLNLKLVDNRIKSSEWFTGDVSSEAQAE